MGAWLLVSWNKHVQTWELYSGISSIQISYLHYLFYHGQVPPEVLHPIFILATQEDGR